MDISKYQDFFHDGSILDILHRDKIIILSIESGEMDEKDLTDKITLSKDDTIKGKLHINGIHNIIINDEPFLGILRKEHDHGNIFELSITKNSIEICVEWIDFPINSKQNDFAIIEIKGNVIYWENIPDLPYD